MAKPKPAKGTKARTDTSTKASRAKHHGRAICKSCTKKLPAGEQFCNATCYRSMHV